MIDLHYWTTPNGHKITMFLEETGLPYKIFPVNIGKGEQFTPEFLAIAPNNRIPAMVDHAPKGGGKPISIFESARCWCISPRRPESFAVGSLWPLRRDPVDVLADGRPGPMAGQNHHFRNYAVENQIRHRPLCERDQPSLRRAQQAPARSQFIAGDYSIADMASYPWVVPYKNQDQNIDDFPHLKRWLETIRARPATERAYAKAKEVNPNFGQPVNRTEEERRILFGQTAAVVR
jgi:GST-like protein